MYPFVQVDLNVMPRVKKQSSRERLNLQSMGEMSSLKSKPVSSPLKQPSKDHLQKEGKKDQEDRSAPSSSNAVSNERHI